jgi:hypothetical protein
MSSIDIGQLASGRIQHTKKDRGKHARLTMFFGDVVVDKRNGFEGIGLVVGYRLQLNRIAHLLVNGRVGQSAQVSLFRKGSN